MMQHISHASSQGSWDCRLKSLELFEEKGRYYFHAIYEVEDDKEIRELDIPKIRVPVRKDRVSLSHENDWVNWCVDMGFGDLSIEKKPFLNGNEVSFTYRVLKTKEPKEMTIAEIEKKLGHKIKIVSEVLE